MISFTVVTFLMWVGCISWLGRAVNRALEDGDKEMLQSKMVYSSQATVIRKEIFLCEKQPCVYTSGYGDRTEMNQGETQNRIYYQITDFNHLLPEPLRIRAVQADKDRVQKFGVRFTYMNDWYDSIEPGAKIYVHHRCFPDGTLQVWGVDLDPR